MSALCYKSSGWRGHRSFPHGDKEYAAALTGTLRRMAVSGEHADEIVSDAMIETSYVPTPYEIYRAGFGTHWKFAKPRAECDHCNGTKFEEVRPGPVRRCRACACCSTSSEVASLRVGG